MKISKAQIAIIGAGPSGLMAAEIMATAGHEVVIYDHMPSPARKFLMAGRGGLNLTHSEPLEMFLSRYGEAAEWISPYIQAFPPDALREWCEGLGQETFVGSSGRVFPRSMKAAPLLRVWLRRLEGLGVQFALRHCWLGWEGEALLFATGDGGRVHVQPDATLLALGGASWPRLGSDGGWTAILGETGVTIAPLRPANGGFIVPWSAHIGERFAGQPLKPVSVTHQGVTRQGEAMVTARGLEGGVIYALSSAIREAIAAAGQTEIRLDLRPAMSVEALARKLAGGRGNKSLSTFLRGAGFSPLALALLREATPADALARATPSELAERLKSLPVTLTASAGMARAISSAGGIAREAVTDDLMLHAKPGVFVAGEMLDWEAPTGGYLLQGCFSTAVAAAKGILGWLERQES